MSISLKKLECFIQDESGQGTIEFAGMLALGAVLALYAYTEGKAVIEPAILAAFNTAKSYLGSIT
jgi:Flp pilus assembly pilin Flp